MSDWNNSDPLCLVNTGQFYPIVLHMSGLNPTESRHEVEPRASVCLFLGLFEAHF